jgi:hypothetical protein
MGRYALFFSLVVVASACTDRERSVDPGADSGMPGTDAGATGVDAGPTDPPDAGPAIPLELLEICRRVGPWYDLACDVEQELITLPADTPRPPYEALFPGIEQFNMNGWEWWQKWPGGFAPTFEYEEATDAGVRCSVASALRYAAIMQDPPEDLFHMLEETTWEGRFFNWNDDFSDPASTGDGTGAVLWAWEYYLLKWISQTNRDGSCYLPTRGMLVEAGAVCRARARLNGDSIQDCAVE